MAVEDCGSVTSSGCMDGSVKKICEIGIAEDAAVKNEVCGTVVEETSVD